MEAYFSPSIAYDIQKIQNEALRLCTGALQSTQYVLFITIILKYLLLLDINNCV